MSSLDGPIDPQRGALVALRLASPLQGTVVAGLGLLDTGSDFTAVRDDIVSRLVLPRIGSTRVRGLTGGAASSIYRCRIDLGVLGSFPAQPVTRFDASIASFEIIVGRDLLRNWVACFNGPARRFEIGPP